MEIEMNENAFFIYTKLHRPTFGGKAYALLVNDEDGKR